MISALWCLVLWITLYALGSARIMFGEPEYMIVDTSLCPRDVDYPRCGIDPVFEKSECLTDRDCKRKWKCCFYGCRKRCLPALKAKTGPCPRMNHVLCRNKMKLPDECRNDEQCPGSSKCCGRCRHRCTIAINSSLTYFGGRT
ncbi:whey acidic -like [Pelobates cultripes]|uniref:Whey acidic -like n=1 Tax=Pelobates cultripes TaxID=61616 RepID=A0AAD1R8L9_PELCU|nr:whey acidic -like [Pelobates cultripes]